MQPPRPAPYPAMKSALTERQPRQDAFHVGKVPSASDETTVPRVRQSLRKRKAGAGRRQRRKSQALKVPRGADIPRVWNDETPSFVERTERLTARGCRPCEGAAWTPATTVPDDVP